MNYCEQAYLAYFDIETVARRFNEVAYLEYVLKFGSRVANFFFEELGDCLLLKSEKVLRT